MFILLVEKNLLLDRSRPDTLDQMTSVIKSGHFSEREFDHHERTKDISRLTGHHSSAE
jgi:hypothetical protein